MLIKDFISFIREREGNDWQPTNVFDIGSRDLDQSVEFASVFPSTQIYAFEPNPTQVEFCETRSQHHPNINFFPIAIGDINGQLKFYDTNRSGNVGASSLLKPIQLVFCSSQEYEETHVPVTRLDTWMEENSVDSVEVLWMDTQGTELSALKGMGSFLENVKYIHCEACPQPYYEGHTLKHELEQFLHDNGFETLFFPAHPHPFGEGDIYAYRI